jgi:AraC-like DNA-binding protein
MLIVSQLAMVPSGRSPRAAQSYAERTPIAPLAGLVRSVWAQQISPDAGPYRHRNIPHGGAEVVWRTGATPLIVGPRTRPAVEVLAAGTTVLGLRLLPGAVPTLFGVPARELVDLSVDAAQLLGTSAVALADRSQSGGCDDTLIALQRLVAGRLAGAAGPDPLVEAAVRMLLTGRNQVVRPLTKSLSISERQLRRRCRDATGLAPKALHRILRFQGFLAMAQFAMSQGRPPTADGLDLLAAEAGYSDQSHLTRECVRLAGLPPGAFLGNAAQNCACGHDHAASFRPILRARARPGAGTGVNMAGSFKTQGSTPP